VMKSLGKGISKGLGGAPNPYFILTKVSFQKTF